MKKAICILFALVGIFMIPHTRAQSSTYVILTSAADSTDPYYAAVAKLRDYRNAQVVVFDPANVNALLPVLTALAPRYAAVVIRPAELQINFVRQFLMMSTQLDPDPFSDFSYGFITGATGPDALAFVDTIIYAATHNVAGYPLNTGGYAASSLNFVFFGASGYLAYLEPPFSSCIYMETNDSGIGRTFFLANSGYMSNNKMLDIGHNGDPHMVWLFEGGNTNPTPPVWNYDPAKIENPAYARAGLTSSDVGALHLYPAVAFNGACHSGEPKTVMVEDDIAATFGSTNGVVQFYTMSDSFSFALSILKTGITGYFAPCGANNANDQGEDVYNAFLYDEPLGDIHKRSNDAVVMGFLGNRPNLKLYTQGTSNYGCDVLPSGTFNPVQYSGACYLLGGKANRIYFGDPLFNPYGDNHSDSLAVTRATVDSINPGTIDITVELDKPDGYWPMWDKFHGGDTRVYIPVELPAWCGAVTGVEVIDSTGPYTLVVHALERFCGKLILHLETDIPNDLYGPIAYSIRFRISCYLTGTGSATASPAFTSAWPVPSEGRVTLCFPDPGSQPMTLVVSDIRGREVQRVTNITTGRLELNQGKEYSPGLYIYRIENGRNADLHGKFIIR